MTCVFFARRIPKTGRACAAMFFTSAESVGRAVLIASALREYFGVLTWVEDYDEPAHVLSEFERQLEARRAAAGVAS